MSLVYIHVRICIIQYFGHSILHLVNIKQVATLPTESTVGEQRYT